MSQTINNNINTLNPKLSTYNTPPPSHLQALYNIAHLLVIIPHVLCNLISKGAYFYANIT